MRTVLFVFLLILTLLAHTQQVERKLIVEKNTFYYTTIHDEFQLATLYKGDINAPIKNAQALALPAGRNYSEPVNPFCWDICNGALYAINFLVHPLNDRYEAIKKIDLRNLKELNAETKIPELLMQSAEMNTAMYNDPYRYITQQSKYLENFFFDGIMVNDSTYCMVVTNKGQLTVWFHTKDKWEHGTEQSIKTDGYFSLFSYKNKLYLLNSIGKTFEVSLNKNLREVPNKLKGAKLTEGFLIENRDKGIVYFMKSSSLNTEATLKTELEKKAIRIL